MARRISPLALPSTTAPARPGVPRAAGLRAETAAVRTAWSEECTFTEQTLTRTAETIERFARRLHAEGVRSFVAVTPAQAEGFIRASGRGAGPPCVATMHARRTAVRVLYRTLRQLDYPVGDPTLDVLLPPRGELAARPLTDDEVTLCRASAQLTRGGWSAMRATAWALGEATAISSEITQVRITDLDNAADPRRVSLPGTRRHDPRVGELSGWGRRVVAARTAMLLAQGAGPATLVAYGGGAPAGGAKAQASVCNAIRDVLAAAGLGQERDLRPASLRHWAGRIAYDRGEPIEAVARMLGHRSLDAAAEDIALTWRHLRPEAAAHAPAGGPIRG